jgi:hypothetical protein
MCERTLRLSRRQTAIGIALCFPFACAAQGARPQNTYAGCQIGANNSVFNTPIDQLPVHPKSAIWIANIARAPLTIGAAWGVNIVDNSTPARKFKFHYTPEKDHVPFQTPQGIHRRRETGSLTMDNDADHHVIAINRETCHVYETYQDGLHGDGWNASSGNEYVSTASTQPGAATDAAGLPLLPLLLHLSEINAGAVSHALRFTSCTACISSESYMWPATTSNGSATPNTAPMGARLRLKAGFDISQFSSKAQIILMGLKKYGMFLADNGMSLQVQTDNDCNLDPTVTAALAEISNAKIGAANFEIVDESHLKVSNSSSLAKTNTQAAAFGPIIGVADPVLIFQAGTPGVQLAAWVNQSSNKALTWAQTSGPGTITTTGVYTPPASVQQAARVSFVVSAVADPSATAILTGTVVPQGAIRIDTGSSRPYFDKKGNLWLADTLGLDTAVYSVQNDNYPRNAWGNLDNAKLYETYIYTWGDDIAYPPFLLANGTYQVTFLFGRGLCDGAYNPNESPVRGPVVLEANASIANFDLRAATNNTCRVPATATLNAEVTNNRLFLAIRATTVNKLHSQPSLSALEIVPLASSH